MSDLFAAIFSEPPEFALAYLKARGHVLPPTFDWRELWHESHTTAFTVAKSAGYDILGDIHGEVTRAMAEGRTFRQFAADLTPVLQKKGWWGRADLVDPLTGELRNVQLGSPRRLRIIYDTNMRTAHAAGNWVRIQENMRTHPFLRYVAILDNRTRDEHKGWHGTLLRVDHSWWKTHYPPNGWRCRCTVMQLSEEDMKMFGYIETAAPETRMVPWENTRTGEVTLVPEGVDPGFAYNVGEQAMREHSARALMGKLDDLPPRIAAEAMADSARFVLPGVQEDLGHWIEDLTTRVRSGDRRMFNERRVVGALNQAQLDFLEGNQGLPGSGSISLGDRDVLHMQRSAKPNRWSVEEMAGLPEILAAPKAILWDMQAEGFLYVSGSHGEGAAKIAVVKVDNRLRIGRGKYRVNSLRTTSVQGWEDLANAGRFRLISGHL